MTWNVPTAAFQKYFNSNGSLEAKAQEYAETLAARGNVRPNHCSPPCDLEGAGENLARAWGSTGAELNATKDW
jgi:hypothetical protein